MFKYLAGKGIAISVNADKRTVIEKILEILGTKNVQDLMKVN